MTEEALAEVSEEVIGVLLDECAEHLENEAKDKAELLKELEEWRKERAEQIEKYKENNDAETAAQTLFTPQIHEQAGVHNQERSRLL